ncbi:MAG TPA: hypothetical protein VL443_04505 [Cyclobacteriaceae bacterium]|jgi:hypothetical protein|nr:hypothetical protein [Cyclobacteriaceae bacterium]
MYNEGDLTFWKYILWGAPIIGGLIGFYANIKINKIELAIKKNKQEVDSLKSIEDLKEKRRNERPLISLTNVWPEFEKQPIVFKCEFSNMSDHAVKVGESKLCLDFIAPSDRNNDLTKRFPNSKSNYVISRFNLLIKANGSHVMEYKFLNKNPAPAYVFKELKEGKRFLVVSGHLEYSDAKNDNKYIYKFIYQMETPDSPRGPNKFRVVLSENEDL